MRIDLASGFLAVVVAIAQNKIFLPLQLELVRQPRVHHLLANAEASLRRRQSISGYHPLRR